MGESRSYPIINGTGIFPVGKRQFVIIFHDIVYSDLFSTPRQAQVFLYNLKRDEENANRTE